MRDIRFYDYSLNLLYILPQASIDTGFTSCNIKEDFNGDGSLEVVFRDDELVKIVEAHRTDLILSWNGFTGFLTGYQLENGLKKLYGMTLTGLLRNFVVPADETETERNAESLIRAKIGTACPWLTLETAHGWSDTIAYPQSSHKQANKWLQELLKQLGWGYSVTVDFVNKTFTFSLIKQTDKNLMLSTANLNAYDFKLSYDNKETAYSGYYQDEEKAWHSVSTATKTGINKREIVLKAKTEAEALNELKEATDFFDLTATTYNIKYREDYKLGDVVGFEFSGQISRKKVSSVNISLEANYTEKPKFEEVEE